jgi:NAD(P)-dependent dehydrogenase (short-subunit alcohol dehydrogenase family)
MSPNLSAKVAIITGSTGGMGAGIASRMAAEGASVVISGRRVGEGQQVVESIRTAGGSAVFIKADVSIEADCINLVKATVEHFGRVDVLVNNAAITPNEPPGTQSVEMWDEIFAVNTRGPFICSREVIPVMRANGGGRIINIGSSVPFRGTINRLAYGCSKGALYTMTKTMARSLLPDRILVNWVTVGWVATPGEINLRSENDQDGEEFLSNVGANAPLGRLETVDEIAAAVLYLTSPEAAHVTGCDINVTGGLWI